MEQIRKYAPILHTGFGNHYTHQQMVDFIEWCSNQGFSGFSAEAKTGTNSNDIEAWVNKFIPCLKDATIEAEKKGLDVWLFDELGYPTGTAAGMTLDGHTEWRSKRLHLIMDIPLEKGQSIELSVPEHFISAAAWHVGRDIFGPPLSNAVSVFPEDGKLVYTATHKRERFCVVSWEYDCFRTRSIFIPDPEDDKQGTLDLLSYEGVAYFISQMHDRYLPLLGEYFGKIIKGFFYDEPYISVPAPYTYDIFPEFEQVKGYDIVPDLPLMLTGHAQAAMLDYRDVCTSRIAKAFYGQLAEWCHAHSVETVGHQDLDHRIRSLDSLSGHFFKNSAYSDAPGIDFIWAQMQPGRFTDFPRVAGSARRLMGKQHAISESFAASSNCLYPDYMRFCLEHQIIRGIDRFFLMIADPVPEDGLFDTPFSKTHPQSITFGAEINHRVAITNMLVNTSTPTAKTAIYVPMSAVFRDMLEQGRAGIVNASPFPPAWKYVEQTAEILSYLPIDFDYIWKESILELPLVNGAFVTASGQRIETIIFTPSTVEEPDVYRKLQTFMDQGGTVLFLTSAPEFFFGKRVTICPEVRRLSDYLDPVLKLSHSGMISVVKREKKDMILYFILNEDEFSFETDITFPDDKYLLKYDYDREMWTDIDEHCIHELFAPMQLVVYAVAKKPAGLAPVRFSDVPVCITGWVAMTPEGENHDLGMDLKDWRDFYQEDYTGWMSYRASFEVLKSGVYRINLGQVCYAAKILLDDKQTCLAAFAPYAADFDLSAGIHTIQVDVLNTAVNERMGSPEAEEANRELAWMKTKIGSDRKYLTSGLLGPVTICSIHQELD